LKNKTPHPTSLRRSQSCFETLGYLAAAAVAAAIAAGVGVSTLNSPSLGYIASCSLYNVAYVQLQKKRTFALLRIVC